MKAKFKLAKQFCVAFGKKLSEIYWFSQQGCQIFLGTTYQNWKNVPN
jgi:DNA-binding XRE family transcriptional regulator